MFWQRVGNWIETQGPNVLAALSILVVAKEPLDANGIEIPFPQRVVHLASALPPQVSPR